MLFQKRSDQLHYVYKVENRTTGYQGVHCINRTPKSFQEMQENSRRGNFQHKISEVTHTIQDGEKCPNCKKVIQSEIIIKGRTGRPPKQ